MASIFVITNRGATQKAIINLTNIVAVKTSLAYRQISAFVKSAPTDQGTANFDLIQSLQSALTALQNKPYQGITSAERGKVGLLDTQSVYTYEDITSMAYTVDEASTLYIVVYDSKFE